MNRRVLAVLALAALAVALLAAPALAQQPPGQAQVPAQTILGILREFFGDLTGSINRWLLGIFVSLLLVVTVPPGVLNGLGTPDPQALDAAAQMLAAPDAWGGSSLLYPYRIAAPGWVPGVTAFGAGLALWLFAAVRGARRVVDGEEPPQPVVLALLCNLGLLAGAPALVSLGSYVFNRTSDTLLSALSPDARTTLGVLMATLGLPKDASWFLVSLLGLAIYGSVAPAGNALNHVLSTFAGLAKYPVLLLCAWAFALFLAGIQSAIAVLFLGLTPHLVWVFGLFGDRLESTIVWLRLYFRAFVAIAVAAAAGMLFYGAYTSGTFGQGPLAFLWTPVLGTGFYLAVAIALWAVWTRPALVLAYGALPALERALEAAGRQARGAARFFARAGMAEEAKLAGALARGFGKAEEAVGRLEESAARLVHRFPWHWRWQDPAGGVGIPKPPEEGGGEGRVPPPPSFYGVTWMVVGGAARFEARTVQVADLLENAGRNQGIPVTRIDARTVEVPADRAGDLGQAFVAEARKKTILYWHKGQLYGMVPGVNVPGKVPKDWIHRSDALLVSDE